MMKSNVNIQESYFGKPDLTRYGFITHMREYIKQLLTNPKIANVDDYLSGYDIDNVKALAMLMSEKDPILTRTEKIYKNDNGKDMFVIKYTLPDKKNFKRKMRNLYIKNFEENIIKGCPIEEECEGGACISDGTPAQGAAQVNANAPIAPIKNNVIRRKTAYFTEDQIREIQRMLDEEMMGGDFAYDAPCFSDAETRDHKNMMAKSWQGSLKENKKKIGARKKNVQ